MTINASRERVLHDVGARMFLEHIEERYAEDALVAFLDADHVIDWIRQQFKLWQERTTP